MNFINEYFIENKLEYFKDLSLDYSRTPEDCHTNNYLENYNGFIKSKLGKHRIINWVNFINFIKLESQRSIDKLYNNEIQANYIKNEENVINNNMFKNIITNDLKDVNNNNIQTDSKDIINSIYSKIGLFNLGASCFINSCIQVLIHCEAFIEGLKKKIIKIKNIKQSISFTFLKICEEINNIQLNKKYIDISYFCNLFGIKHPNYNGSIQQDCQEFLRMLLDDISIELNEGNINAKYSLLSDDNNKSKILKNLQFINIKNKKEKSIVSELFYLDLVSTFICQCKKVSYTFQTMLDIPLLLPEIQTQTTIIDLLNSYFNDEKVDF